jgi:two-component system, NtrC family, sensor kinase
MRALRDVPIRRKLTIVVMLATWSALLVAALASVAYQVIGYRNGLVHSMSSIALMIGDNSAAALSFNDPSSAGQTLRSLSAHPHITGAVLYDAHGKAFATYKAPARQRPFRAPDVEPDGHRFGNGEFRLFRGFTIAGENAGTVYIESDLEEMRAGLWRFAWIAALTMLAASGVGYLLSAQLQAGISGRISHLAGIVGIVAQDKNYSVRASREGEDELGRLIDGFNEMLSRIQVQDAALQDARATLEKRVRERTQELIRTHERLIEASRQAGMAEIATNVLHDVGNVLNSVNVSASLVIDTVSSCSKAESLVLVTQLLREHRSNLSRYLSDDPRGRYLPEFLDELARMLEGERQLTLSELQLLRKNVDHIKDIVMMQQAYARVGGVEAITHVNELLEDSVRLNAGALGRRHVEVVRDFGPIAPILVDKHKVLQILVNLLRNANIACEESARFDKRVQLRTRQHGDRIAITVVDNGVGIAPENMSRIFGLGFTTRASGHGFGLHGAALAARELGGSLSVHSEGLGCGAAFTLELPCVPADTHARSPTREFPEAAGVLVRETHDCDSHDAMADSWREPTFQSLSHTAPDRR